jgi:hypothetical protein
MSGKLFCLSDEDRALEGQPSAFCYEEAATQSAGNYSSYAFVKSDYGKKILEKRKKCAEKRHAAAIDGVYHA